MGRDFLAVAAVVYGLALGGLHFAYYLVDRYDERLESGLLAPRETPPVFRKNEVLVAGAELGPVPDLRALEAVRALLEVETEQFPFHRTAVRRAARGPMGVGYSFFVPHPGLAEAADFCANLGEDRIGCAPAIATRRELLSLAGNVLTDQEFDRIGAIALGVALPSRDIPAACPAAAQTPVCSFAAADEAAAAPQPPLALQPPLRGTLVPPGATERIWLSRAYRPGDPRLVSVVAAGDTMMGSNYPSAAGLNRALKPDTDAASIVGADLAAIFRRADIAMLNLEGPLYDGTDPPAKACENCFAFRSPTYYARILASLGIDAVGLANNHSGDFGVAGRRSTVLALREAGIAAAGLTRSDARSATLILSDGRRVGFVAFAPNTGTLPLNDPANAAAIVASLARTHDLVVVGFHGGAEGWAHVRVPKTSEYYFGENRGDVVRFAHMMIDAGADLVIGHGPHVPRAVEFYRGRLIAYSLGNFWTHTGILNYAVSGLGPVIEAWLEPSGALAGFSIHSTRQAGLGVPHLDPLGEAARYVAYLTGKDFPQTRTLFANAERVPGGQEGDEEAGRPLGGAGS